VKLKDEIKQTKFASLRQEAAINMVFTNAWINSQMKSALKTYKVSPQQYYVLRILRGVFPEKVSSGHIKERMVDKESNITRLVDKLIEKKYVLRNTCPENRRKIDIAITEAGLDNLKVMDEMVNKIDDIFNKLDNNELVELNRLLEKLRE